MRQRDMPCSIEDCPRPRRGRGWCGTHWLRWRKHGSPLAIDFPSRGKSLAEKFELAVIRRSTGCWEWNGCFDPNGYTRLYHAHRGIFGHRFSYEQARGPIPIGMEIDHLCRNTGCTNPEHLEPVPHRINVLRGIGTPAVNAVKTACPRGHQYDTSNTIRYPDGRRWCRKCKNQQAREYRRRRADSTLVVEAVK